MNWIDIDKLSLSDARPAGFIPKPPPSLRRRIRTHGVVDPIVARPIGADRYEILSNPEAWVAAGEVGLHRVPVLLRDDLTDSEAADIVNDHYGTQKNNAVDEAENLALRLEDLGGRACRGSITKLSLQVGRSRPYIAHALRLLSLPIRVQEHIRSGRMTAGHGRPLVAMRSRADQIELAEIVIAEKLSVRSTEALAREYRKSSLVRTKGIRKTGSRQGSVATKSPDILRLEQGVTDLLGCRFEIQGDKAVFDYYGDLDILQGILNRIGYRG